MHQRLFLSRTMAVAVVVTALTATQGRAADNTFSQDVDYLRKHVKTIVLQGDNGESQVAVVPAYQGRVMTSTASGESGTSFGWINYQQVASGIQKDAQINVFGGEERFWLGPEGGQYSLFFKPGAKFEFSDWKTPPLIDTEPFVMVEQGKTRAVFQKEASITNYSGSRFKLRIKRHVELLSAKDAAASLNADIGDARFVGYRSTNRLTNTGDTDWKKENGLLSIWLLGMYKPGSQTTVVIPYQSGPEEQLGTLVNDSYFGKVPNDRLRVTDKAMFFSGDGTYRSKIGLSPQRSKDICGSYDGQRNVLTIVKYNKPPKDVTDYVNSMWELQDHPYVGDVINAYNDGPAGTGGRPFGTFL